MNKFQRIAFISLLSLFLFACSGGGEESATQAAGAKGSEQYPAMSLDGLNDYLAANTGKPTIVMVWTTWCPSCKQELPEMEALNKSHAEKVNVITISMDENLAALEKFFEDKSLDLPVFHGDVTIAKEFRIDSIPTMLIFDKAGKLVFNEPGIFPHSMLSAMADKVASE